MYTLYSLSQNILLTADFNSFGIKKQNENKFRNRSQIL